MTSLPRLALLAASLLAASLFAEPLLAAPLSAGTPSAGTPSAGTPPAGPAALPAAAQDTPSPPASPAPSPLRVFTVGASVSAGFGLSAELATEKDVALAVFLEAALTERGRERVTFVDEGQGWFVNAPYKTGAKLVDAAIAGDADLVVGVDFLFWYAYGNGSRISPRRAKGLEAGLRQLERLKRPLIIGDLPDISHALGGRGPFGPPIVNRSMFPSSEELRAMNQTIRAWAEGRPEVRVLPLADLMRRYVESEPVTVRDLEWRVSSLGEALQKDLLHPNARGTAWVAMILADEITGVPGFDAEDFRFDEAAVLGQLDVLTRTSRERRAKKERRRAERKAEREARAQEKEQREREQKGKGQQLAPTR